MGSCGFCFFVSDVISGVGFWPFGSGYLAVGTIRLDGIF